MAKLYQRQNPLLSRGQIIQPEKQPSISAAVVKFGASALDEIAKDNFALGHANLTDNIIQTAYEQNPMDVQGFNDMVKAGIEKSTKNLPGDMARHIRLNATQKANALNAQIRNNYTKAKTAELEQNVQASIDNITGDGPMGLQFINNGLMESLAKNDPEGIKAWGDLWKAQSKKLQTLAELKNPITGAYVIGKESARNEYKQALFGKTDAFRNQIEKMSKDELINFHNNIFQDPEFMKSYGVKDYTTQDKLKSIINNRLKEFGAEDEKVIHDHAYFEASKIAKIDPAVLDDIENNGTLSQETVKLLRDAIKESKKVGSAEAGINLDQNEGFLAGIMELQNAISTNDGSADYNEKLLQAAAKVSVGISKMRQNGLGEEQAEILQQALSGIVSDQNFANALDMSDNSLLSEIARGANYSYNQSIESASAGIREKYKNNMNPMAKRQMEQELKDLEINKWANPYFRSIKTEFSDLTKKALNEMAARYSAHIIALEQTGAHDEAMQFKEWANKELIFRKYGDWISRQEFNRLENDLKSGRDAYTNINGSVFRYKGLTENGIILEGEF